MEDHDRWADLRLKLSLPSMPDRLLKQAFQHGSYVREQQLSPLLSNQRLEFLGDAVLDLIIAEDLYRAEKHLPEGDLTKRKAAAVQAKSLARIARDMGLGEYLLLGRGEEETGGRKKASLLADCLEALVGAVYLAAGLEATREFVLRHFSRAATDVAAFSFDYKTALQELIQHHTKRLPSYATMHTEGPPHRRTFTVAARFAGAVIGSGSGSSKREAEQAAAADAMEHREDWFPTLRNRSS